MYNVSTWHVIVMLHEIMFWISYIWRFCIMKDELSLLINYSTNQQVPTNKTVKIVISITSKYTLQ